MNFSTYDPDIVLTKKLTTNKQELSWLVRKFVKLNLEIVVIFSELHFYYSRVPNITGVPNKSVGGNFFLKINKTGGDIINKKSQIRTFEKE